MAKILYVEDDPTIADGVQQWLEHEGHTVEIAKTAEDAVQLCRNFDFDLLLLDRTLPGMSGLEFCRKYREMDGTAWVIFLTAMSGLEDRVTGLDAGADDYLVKPFAYQEVAARVRSALRRSGGKNFQANLELGGLELNILTRTITTSAGSLHLMPKESALLEYLMRNPTTTSSSKKLLSAVWPSEAEVSEGTVRSFMLSLRKKLDSLGKGDFIKTVAKSGYVLEPGDL
jgi:two-component system OmpR family response regulator